MRGPGGLELTLKPEHVVLVEDIEVINSLRVAISNAFYSKAPPKVAAATRPEDSIEVSEGKGNIREPEVVPQLAAESAVCDALDNLFKTFRECSTRMQTMDTRTWNSRLILSKPNMQTVRMHRDSGGVNGTFTLFEPLVDLSELKRQAEFAEREAERLKRLAEEEKQRKKEEDRRTKQEQKRFQKIQEQQARKEEERRLAAERKGKGKGKAKGKSKDKDKDKSSSAAAPQQNEDLEGGGKGKKGKQKGSGKDSGKSGKKGKKSSGASQQADAGAAAASSAAVQPPTPMMPGPFGMPIVPPPWVAVPDPSGRAYYWNQATGEVTWTKPSMPQAGMFFNPMAYPGSFCQ